ncbi:MAG: aryl-sulfate sulfotransferase [Ruminiclostridium sp.]|nr:aryl-sulfate sulfotransferase [Ruminiclostridium sp.]
MTLIHKILGGLLATSLALLPLCSCASQTESVEPVIADGLVGFTVEGETDLSGNFYLSFPSNRDLILLDGKGNIVWSKHEEISASSGLGSFWDFKKHEVDGEIYYSYHDETGTYDNYGLVGYSPGERVILDKDFNEIKRITFEASDVVEQGAPLDGHDFLMIDLDHYILSGYIKDTVYNVPGYEDGTNVTSSYLQEVKDGQVVWDFNSADYPELYERTAAVSISMVGADDFANQVIDGPDYIHFNSMQIADDGTLVCSFRHIHAIMGLDRTADSQQILWTLSGAGDEFGLSEWQKSSGQHYATIDGDYITVFDNGNASGSSRVVSYCIDPETKTLEAFRAYSLGNKYSEACGSAQHLYDEVYVIGWGAPTQDTECMSVCDFSTGETLMTVKLDNPMNTYRCVYYD